jgi:hypothetical protein
MNMNDTILDDELFRRILRECRYYYTSKQISKDTGIGITTIYNYKYGAGMSVKKKQAIFKSIEKNYPQAFERTQRMDEYMKKWEREKAEREKRLAAIGW